MQEDVMGTTGHHSTHLLFQLKPLVSHSFGDDFSHSNCRWFGNWNLLGTLSFDLKELSSSFWSIKFSSQQSRRWTLLDFNPGELVFHAVSRRSTRHLRVVCVGLSIIIIYYIFTIHTTHDRVYLIIRLLSSWICVLFQEILRRNKTNQVRKKGR